MGNIISRTNKLHSASTGLAGFDARAQHSVLFNKVTPASRCAKLRTKIRFIARRRTKKPDPSEDTARSSLTVGRDEQNMTGLEHSSGFPIDRVPPVATSSIGTQVLAEVRKIAMHYVRLSKGPY